jgi:hypothetical protein
MNKNNSQNPQLPQTAVKCRFFAQYWGQNYNLDNGTIKWEVNHRAFPLDETATLLLKPLSKITDEDLSYIFPDNKRASIKREIKNVLFENKSILLEIKFHYKDGYSEFYRPINDLFYIDYLRSKGYAVPFMQYSVEDLVSFGWVQLT